jgi:hypothetical protein
MKKLILIAMGSAALCVATSMKLRAAELLPGQVDFGTFAPPKGGGEFVEVNVPESLISLGARFVEKDEPEVAQLLKGLKLVRVHVIGLDEENRAELQKRAQGVRKELTGNGWERIVVAQQKDQDVSVYLKMAEKGAVQGLIAMVMDGKEHAVFVNIVGDIKPEQLALLGEKLHIDPLKKIGHRAEKAEEKPKEKAPEKAED